MMTTMVMMFVGSSDEREEEEQQQRRSPTWHNHDKYSDSIQSARNLWSLSSHYCRPFLQLEVSLQQPEPTL
jgi:hypothetical protein